MLHPNAGRSEVQPTYRRSEPIVEDRLVIRGLANAPAGVYVVGARPKIVKMAPVIQRVHSRAPHCATSSCTRALRSDIPARGAPGRCPRAPTIEAYGQTRCDFMTYAGREPENRWRGTRNRILQTLAREAPGAETTRVRLHRARGVNIGANVWIGYDVILDTGFPHLITIEDNAALSVRVTIIAHMWEAEMVTIERDAYLGVGVIVLPSVVVGHGAVVTAGSVVTRSIPPLTLAQGNPAVAIAKLSTPFRRDMTQTEFYRTMRPLR